MYSVVQYDNTFMDVLPTKSIKKREGYAVAKNYQVKILYENGNKLNIFMMILTN